MPLTRSVAGKMIWLIASSHGISKHNRMLTVWHKSLSQMMSFNLLNRRPHRKSLILWISSMGALPRFCLSSKGNRGLYHNGILRCYTTTLSSGTTLLRLDTKTMTRMLIYLILVVGVPCCAVCREFVLPSFLFGWFCHIPSLSLFLLLPSHPLQLYTPFIAISTNSSLSTSKTLKMPFSNKLGWWMTAAACALISLALFPLSTWI